MYFRSWIIFIKERFDPLSHLIMILLFVMVHILFTKEIFPIYIPPIKLLILLLGVILFYFKLRLYDEVKDYELDLIINPNRPLPRGLLKLNDMYWGIGICILLELICFSFQGVNAITSLIIAILYSLLMYKEFFIKEIIRPHLTTYAVSHTVVTSLLTFSIFCYLNQKTFLQNFFNTNLLFFALSNWMLFNIFEFGRKTFATIEERTNIDTYSSLFGRKLAVFLVFSQAIISMYFTFKIEPFQTWTIMIGLGLLLLLLLFFSARYINTNKRTQAKNYRAMSSFYIVLFYVILIIGLLTK